MEDSSVLRYLYRLFQQAKAPPTTSPETRDYIRQVAPILIDWIHRASSGESSPGHVRIRELLTSAFENGDVSGIYRLSDADTDIALTIMLNAYDVSREDHERVKKGARGILVDTFRRNVSKLNYLPSCFLLDKADIVLDPTVEARKNRVNIVHFGTYRGTPVAMKEGLRDFFFKQSISRSELAVWRTLSRNKHIVPLLGIAHIEITPGAKPKTVLIMPRFSKNDVASHLASHWLSLVKTPPKTIFWIMHTAEGLIYLHSNEVAHGNLCAENVLLDEDDHAWLGGLGGSGLAMKVALATKTAMTQAHRRQFLAPEQADDEYRCIPTTATDIWTFGLFCIQLFVGGQGPYAEMQGGAPTLKEVVDGARPPQPKMMDDDLWHIVVDCLAKRPADRPTAKALFSRITQIRSAQPHAMYRYLSAPLSSDHGTQVFERMKVFAREHSLNKITQFVGDEAQVAMDILYQALLQSDAVPPSHANASSARLTRTEVRPLLVTLVLQSESFPSKFQAHQDALVLDWPDNLNPGADANVDASAENNNPDANAKADLPQKVTCQATLYGSQVTVTCVRNDGARRDALRESMTLKSLRDIYIVPFLGTHKTPSDTYIILPCMSNARDYLKELLAVAREEDVKILEDTERKERRNLYKETQRLLGQTAGAIKYLHDEGIVHSNIRGANILVGTDANVCLSDFSRSRIDGLDESLSSQFAGEPGWLAPELLRSFSPRDNKVPLINPPVFPTRESDIYSYGRVCIELYACEDPHIALKNANYSITKLIPSRLSHLVNWCCDEAPGFRPKALQLVEARIEHIVLPGEELLTPFGRFRFDANPFTTADLLDSLSS